MSIDNEAVSLRVEVDLSWYRLGHQFAELNDEDQYQFFVGMLDSIRHWEAPIKNLDQLQAIANRFDEHNPDLKPELSKWINDFNDRITA